MLCYVIPMLMTLVMHLCSPCNRRTINFYDNDDDDEESRREIRRVGQKHVKILNFSRFMCTYVNPQLDTDHGETWHGGVNTVHVS